MKLESLPLPKKRTLFFGKDVDLVSIEELTEQIINIKRR